MPTLRNLRGFKRVPCSKHTSVKGQIKPGIHISRKSLRIFCKNAEIAGKGPVGLVSHLYHGINDFS